MLSKILTAHEVTQYQLAEVLDIGQSAISRKLAGDRPWKESEIRTILAFLSERLGRPVTYEEAFLGTETEGEAA